MPLLLDKDISSQVTWLSYAMGMAEQEVTAL